MSGDVGKIKGPGNTGNIGNVKKPSGYVHKVIKEEAHVSPFGTTGSTISKEALKQPVAETKGETVAKETKLLQSREQVPTFLDDGNIGKIGEGLLTKTSSVKVIGPNNLPQKNVNEIYSGVCSLP